MADPGATSAPTPEAAETTSYQANEIINQNGSARNDPTSGASTVEVESEEKKTANTEKTRRQAAVVAPVPNIKSKMAKGFRSLLSWGTVSPNPQDANPTAVTLFKKVDPAVDGDDCDRDCASCSIHYPRGFKIEEHEDLYGGVKPWEKHLVVATGKSDWVRDVVDEKGSVMQAVGSVKGVKLSASNMPFPHGSTSYADPTTVLLLPAMTMVDGVSPANVPALLKNFVEPSVKNTTLLGTASAAENNNNGQLAEELEKLDIGETQGGQTEDIPAPTSGPALKARPCPHQVLILLCSQRTRDARCGQSAPLLRREFERHLRPLGLYRDLDDERPGGVGIYFISHVGGHKWSANVIIYRRQNAFGVDGATWAEQDVEQETKKVLEERKKTPGQWQQDTSAAQCIWLARVKPEDIEGVVKFTVLQGKTVKPEWQLRGGFDREKGLFSW